MRVRFIARWVLNETRVHCCLLLKCQPFNKWIGRSELQSSVAKNLNMSIPISMYYSVWEFQSADRGMSGQICREVLAFMTLKNMRSGASVANITICNLISTPYDGILVLTNLQWFMSLQKPRWKPIYEGANSAELSRMEPRTYFACFKTVLVMISGNQSPEVLQKQRSLHITSDCKLASRYGSWLFGIALKELFPKLRSCYCGKCMVAF